MRFPHWLREKSIHPFFPLLVLGLALLLTLPTLGNEFIADDHMHRSNFLQRSLTHPTPTNPMMSMFQFFGNEPKTYKRMMDLGLYPWWTPPTVQAKLWRPVSAATHWFDYTLWPHTPWLMHLHNILWMLLTCGVAFFLFQALFGKTWVAAVGWLLFVINDSFAIPVAWIANRNALIALFFSLLCLYFHHRWRQGERLHAWTAHGMLALALLSAEAGLATCAYLFAYTCCLDKNHRGWKRFSTLLGYGVLVVLWRGLYTYLGFGIKGSGLYLDPLHSSGEFVTGLLRKLPVFLLGEWFPPASADVYVLLPAWGKWLHVGLGVGFLLLLAWVLWTIRSHKLTGFLVVGMVLSLVPFCATEPNGRLLLWSSFGGMGLIAVLMETMVPPPQESAKEQSVPPSSPLFRGFVMTCLVSHLLVGVSSLPLKGMFAYQLEAVGKRIYKTTRSTRNPIETTLVVINTPIILLDIINLERKHLNKEPFAGYLRVLGTAHTSQTIERIDVHTLRMSPQDGFLFVIGYLFRSNTNPMKPGEVIKLPDMTATVRRVDSQ